MRATEQIASLWRALKLFLCPGGTWPRNLGVEFGIRPLFTPTFAPPQPQESED